MRRAADAGAVASAAWRATAASRLRSPCQGAAARSVSTTCRRTPAPRSPRRAPSGRPRALLFCWAPEPAELPPGARCVWPNCSAASSPGGIAACAACSTKSSSSCGVGCWVSASASGGGGSPAACGSSGGASGSDGGSSAGSSCGMSGTRVARGASTRAAARLLSSLFTWLRPSSAAAARAARRASMGARSESTPSASAAPHSDWMISPEALTCGSCWRAAATAAASMPAGSSGASPPSGSTRWKASRSSRRAGSCSSSLLPSSSATRPSRAGWRSERPLRSITASPLSSTWASRATVAAGTRSALASSAMPPWHCASSPVCATGRPWCRVAARSSPPSRRLSSACKGMRRQGCSCGNKLRSSCSQCSRCPPARARKATPPRPAGSTANRAATVPDGPPGFMIRTAPPRRGPPAPWSRHRPAGCGAAGGAGPTGPPGAGGHHPRRHPPRARRARARHGSA